MESKLYRLYSEDLFARVSVAFTASVLKEMIEIQSLYPLAAMGIGRLISGTFLLAAQLKEGFSISVRFKGDGPLRELFSECHPNGLGRGFCAAPQAELPRKKGHLDLASGIGQGHIIVCRSQPYQKEPHTSVVPIMTGEIASDLTHYIRQSNQTLSVMALATSFTPEEGVTHSGGVLVELMPETPESILSAIEKKVASAPPLSQLFKEGATAEVIASYFCHTDKIVSRETPIPLKFFCPCTMERVERTLLLLGRAALAEMVLKREDVQVSCGFCGRKYQVEPVRVRALLSEFPEVN